MVWIGKVLLFIVFLLQGSFLQGQGRSGWALFENAIFKDVFVEEYRAYGTLLVRNDPMKRIDGSIITITGYYIPVGDPDLIILSKYPYANCFFCGGAGMESILEVIPKNKPDKKWKVDEKLTFQGRLVLNYDDWNRVCFILEDAEWIN